MAPPKKSNANPLSAIENIVGQGTSDSSGHAARLAAFIEAGNRLTGATVPNSIRSRGSRSTTRPISTVESAVERANLQRSNRTSRVAAIAGTESRPLGAQRSVAAVPSSSRGRIARSSTVEPRRGAQRVSFIENTDGRDSRRPSTSHSRAATSGETGELRRGAQQDGANARNSSRRRYTGSAIRAPTVETEEDLRHSTRRSTRAGSRGRDETDEQDNRRPSTRSSSRAARSVGTGNLQREAHRDLAAVQNSSRGAVPIETRDDFRRSTRAASRARDTSREAVPNRRQVSFAESTTRQHNALHSNPTIRTEASAESQGPQTRERRGVATVSNSSSGSGTGGVVNGIGARRVAAVTFSIVGAGSSALRNENDNMPGAESQSRRTQKRRPSAAPLPTQNAGSTRYVADDENSQPSTSSAPPRKIHRAAPTQSTNNGNSSRQSGFACCDKHVPPYNSFIRFCAKGCEIAIGEKYRSNHVGTVYCLECFDAKHAVRPFKEENWKELENKNDSEEKTLTCDCGAKYHQCCSLELQESQFTCSACITSNDLLIRTMLIDYSKNKFEEFMEDRLNTLLKNRLPADQLACRLSVVCYKQKKETSIKQIVSRPLHRDFTRLYGEKIEYDMRTIYLFQRLEGVDVIVFAMVCQEYKDIRGKSWVVIDYLDSVPFVEPAEARGAVFREAILSYFAWAKKMGFNHAHFFSNPPQQGTDFILSIHPTSQKYKKPAALLGYYNNLLAKGVERKILAEVRTLEREHENNPYSQPTDFLPFDGGLWPNCLREVDERITKKFGKLPAEEYAKKLVPFMKRKFKDNAKNNFFIDLNLTSRKVSDPDDIKSHSVLGDRDAFLEKCRKENWEFSSLRRAKFTSVAVIEMMTHAADQRGRMRE
ncbi:hypothetical protein CAEBREN_04501 [Caenorhabditis brenneri]|uniref:histone acetyltransferase n=1 Tax=Caenorhabditis brenneri TaxID=135651 RepID=G0ND54_CAEBE|nr:hypothetical protein CAEBREN_04501 [Caenorhabditis brenneri]